MGLIRFKAQLTNLNRLQLLTAQGGRFPHTKLTKSLSGFSVCFMQNILLVYLTLTLKAWKIGYNFSQTRSVIDSFKLMSRQHVKKFCGYTFEIVDFNVILPQMLPTELISYWTQNLP